ncbi:beta-ketoacyl-ACP synthase III [Stagnimonas aquatica]|uniref:Beta-ketoacyl-ACP synthase III n=1 Tax=Stagnimonas aquatica TaxID=2689987 RepID=A0A3N0V9L8_9GAMM|nr:beta-ketoacyl-ACP synthase III [Stagnimonas aquatica]ROH89476.1 beta-ketoacyl-ACP synthase III [Stagnimonas aquatica]
MTRVAITGSGLFTPAESISNDELVACYNAYAERENSRHAEAIAAGTAQPLPLSSSEFIVKASGIKSRYVVDKAGVLDIDFMRPRIRTRGNDEPSLMAEMGAAAARQALATAGRDPSEVDFIICAASNLQRPYPAVAVELQQLLGAGGFAYDMNVACASAAFGIQSAVDAVRLGNAKCALVINPEICSGHLNWRNRDCHFIFGDAATAVVIEPLHGAKSRDAFEVMGTRLKTQFSNNIRNNFGFLNASEIEARPWNDVLFQQEGRKVFKEVVPMVSELLLGHLAALGIAPESVKRFWLHQANLSMNQFIARKVLGRDATETEAPVILDEYANTSSAGCIIAFHKHHADLAAGELGLLSGFGAGYSAGSAILRKL